ncbi:hypothetical protein HDU89_001014 [Geranomyces variabilis]|nr:hypothetical protein HDU89_001014 [Geranomyces variabilis]
MAALRLIKAGEGIEREAEPLLKLHNDLAKMEQETVDLQSLSTVQKDLRAPSLMSHRDKGVKALTACCLAEILRLFAPDAPYSQNQLREIFEFFAKQLQNLSEKDGPYFSKYFALLDSLSSVKSVVIVADLNADDLVIVYFRTFFNLLKHDLSKAVTMAMLDILQQLVDECHALPQEVVDLLLKCFKKREDRPNAYKMATDLCNASPERLQRYVCQHLGDAIVAAGHGFDEDDYDEEMWQETHALILEINRAAPAVLLNVIPLLDEELQIEAVKVRTLATNTLGEMFSARGSELARKYPQTWKSWLGRRADKSNVVRIAWVDWALPLLKNHPELAPELNVDLRERCMDPDEKVRAAVMKVLAGLDALAAHNVTRELLVAAGDRMRDKRAHVREAAVDALAQLFNIKYAEILDPATGEAGAAEKYGWIPGAILEMLYMDDAETKVVVEKALCDRIFPPNTDDVVRTERLLNIAAVWTERQRKAFMNVLDRQSTMMGGTAIFLDLCEKFNGGIMDDDTEGTEDILNRIIEQISSRFPDAKTAQTQLQKFAKANDGRIYKLMRSVMDLQSDYKPLIKNIKEIIKRLEQQAGALETFSILLRRISLTIVAKSSISILIDKIQLARSSQDEAEIRIGETAEKLLKDISTVFPALYRSHLDEFRQLLQSSDDALVTDSLDALARFARVFPEETPRDSASKERLIEFALEGTPSQAKDAAIVLAHMGDESGEVSNQVLETIISGLTFENEKLLTQLSALSQLAEDYAAFSDHHDTAATNFIVKELLFVNHQLASDDDVDWLNFADLPREGVLKVLGIEFLTKRLVAISAESGAEKAQPVFKLLQRLIEFDGEIVAEKTTPKPFQTHLRLAAGLAFLELARCPKYAAVIGPTDLYKIALVVQDPIYQVRNAFIEKLVLYLSNQSIPFEYNILLMVAAHEPEIELRNKVKHFFIRRAKMRRSLDQEGRPALIEHTFVRFLHLLAHHTDFAMGVEDLGVFAVYVEFFLDAVATAENASFLYYMASKLKTYRDLHAQSSANLYAVSDLAQLLIQEKANQAGWSLPSYQGNVHLPKDIFGKLSAASSAEVSRKSYLPQEFVTLRAKLTSGGGAHGGKRSSLAKRDPAAAAKLAAAAKAGMSATTTPNASDDEGGEERATGSKRKARKRNTGTPSARKRRRSDPIEDDIDEDDSSDNGTSGSRRSRPLPVETPQRKNAPRGARKADSFLEVSEAEDQEDEDDDVQDDGDAKQQGAAGRDDGSDIWTASDLSDADARADKMDVSDAEDAKPASRKPKASLRHRPTSDKKAVAPSPDGEKENTTSRGRQRKTKAPAPRTPRARGQKVAARQLESSEDDEPLATPSRVRRKAEPPAASPTPVRTSPRKKTPTVKKIDSGNVPSDEGAAALEPATRRRGKAAAAAEASKKKDSDSDEADLIPTRRVTRRAA